MSVSDTAVGAILEIPPELLGDIKKAEQYIKELGETSQRVANEVSGHWGTVATGGLDAFIRKLQEATGVMSSISGKPIEFNINTNQATEKVNTASEQIKKDLDAISATVQQVAQNFNFDNAEEVFRRFYTTIGQAEQGLKRFQDVRAKMDTEDPEINRYNRIIELLKEYIEVKKRSEERQTQLNKKDTDTENLNQQKILLQQIAQTRKDINAMTLEQARSERLGKAIPQEDIDRLKSYKEELERLKDAYDKLKNKTGEMSTAGQNRFNAADIKAQLAETSEATAAQERFNQAIQNTKKLLSETKLKSAGISSREESIYMNEQVAVYQQMLKVIKTRGDLEAKIAAQGYAQTAEQTNYLKQLQNEYDRLNGTLSNVTGTYAKIDENVNKAFQNSKMIQEAENAAKLADAYQKVADAADKKNKADAKSEKTDLSKDRAEYKRVLTLIEQMEKTQRRLNEAMASANLPSNLAQQIQSSMAAADAALNSLYNRRAELESKRGQELIDIQQQNEAKKGAVAVAEHEKAEKEKTRISKQEATDRYTEEMRQARLQNQALTAQGKQQRMSINDAKEQRAIELAEQRKREVERLRQEIDKLDKTDANYQKDLDRLNQRINELLGTTQRRVTYTREEAMAMAQSAKTLKDYENAYKALKEVMSTTDPKNQQWQEMNTQLQKMKSNADEIRKKMGEFRNETSRTNGIVSQLKNSIVAAFSISAISGFLKKVTEVRAQFELQRVALGAIIQDRDEANKIFTQVQNMALESPFSIMQLEKATKQTAAFGFEAKKLVPTMKMFADLGAGLGVELERITLVMGHLKARGFLEGTMVRQFTNMGFNVLGELSKYYTELEGKIVSVAEVQARVKKKMVAFGDVEEVLKRVTSAGGMFYDMQKKQSDSIWGQMQRITDAYDLMLNEIGQSNEGTIKGVLTLVRKLIGSWRELAPIIQSVGVAIFTYFVRTSFAPMIASVVKLGGAFSNLRTIINGTKAAQDALNASQLASGYGALLAVLAAVGLAIYNIITYKSQLDEALERVGNEGMTNMYDLIFQYRQLADTVKDTTKTYEERKKAMDELNRIYKDIVPDQMLEIDNIRKMKDGYEEATAAIKAYSAEKTKSNLKAEIENIFGKKITEQINDTAKTFSTIIKMSDIMPEDMTREAIQGGIRNIMIAISEEVKAGTLKQEAVNNEFRERFKKSFNVTDEDLKSTGYLETWFDEWNDELSGIFEDMTDKFGEITDFGIKDFYEIQADPAVKQYEKLEKAVSEYINALKNLREEQEKGGINGVNFDSQHWYDSSNTEMGYEALQTFFERNLAMKAALDEYSVTYQITADEINNAIQSNVDMMEYEGNMQNDVFNRVLSNFKNWGKGLQDNPFVAQWLESLRVKVDGFKFSGIRKEIADTQRDIARKFALTEAIFDKFKWDGMTSYSDVQKQAKQLTDEAKTQIKEIAAVRAEMILLGHSAAEAQQIAESRVGITEQEAKDRQKAYEAMWKAFGGSENEKNKKSSDTELKRWQDLKKAIEDVRTAYEKYRKSYNVEESNARIEKLFGPAFKELGHDISEFYKDGKYDAEALIDALEVLKGMTKATTEERKKFRSEIERKIGTTQVEIEVKMKEDAEKKLKADLDEMFANYELSEELKKIGVSVDLTYMVGGKPTTLQSIRAEIARLRAEGGDKTDAENRIKILEDAEKKLIQIEEKNQRQRLKNYVKYLTESMGERAQIEIKALQDINKIREDATLDQFSKEQAIMQRRKKMNEELSKMDLDGLKSSDVYISVFKDLERASKEQLQYVLNKLKELQSTFKDLSPAQVKSIASEMKKIEDALADKDSVKNLGVNLRDAVKYARERNELLREQTSLQNTIEDSDKALEAAQTELYNLELKRKGIQDENTEEWEEANDAVLKQQAYVLALQAQIKALQEQIEGVTEEIDKGESKWKGFQSGISKVRQGMKDLMDSFDSVFEGLDSMGLVNDAFRDTYESIGEIMNGVDTFLGGLESMDISKPFSIITGGIKSIGGILQTIGAAFGIGDKKKERQIQRLVEKVDNLDKAYQRLEKSIDAAYTFDDYNAGYRQMQQNLEAQKRAYEEMIRLEDAKKKTDDEKIKEYKEKLQEIADAQDELRKERIEAMGSTTDYLSEAQSFVDAWLDAYKETGNGLDALSESWEEFVEGLFVKQGAAQIVSARLQKVIQQINDAIESGATDFDLADAVNKAREDWKKEAETIEPLLEQLFGSYGLGSGNGELILSDLQKGIQNITEPQAAAIEAYLNSMRFAVFRHTEQLDALITTIQAQYGSGAENPVVTELKGIRGVLDNIYSTLRSVVKTQVGKTGIVIVG